jgi:hypothetical protein
VQNDEWSRPGQGGEHEGGAVKNRLAVIALLVVFNLAVGFMAALNLIAPVIAAILLLANPVVAFIVYRRRTRRG